MSATCFGKRAGYIKENWTRPDRMRYTPTPPRKILAMKSRKCGGASFQGRPGVEHELEIRYGPWPILRERSLLAGEEATGAASGPVCRVGALFDEQMRMVTC